MRRVRTTWLAWAMGLPSIGLGLGAVVLAGRNGESLGELAGVLDQPAGHRHHHHPRLPAVPRRPAAVAPVAAGGLGDGRGHRAPDRHPGRAGLASASGSSATGCTTSTGCSTAPWVYGLLTVSLAATYAAGVLLAGRMVSGGRTNSLVVAAATIEAFAVRLRQQVDPDALRAELLAVVDHTVEPTRASLWLRPGR